MRSFGFLIILFFSPCSFSEVYTWTDENGKKYFSDKKPIHFSSQAKDVKYNNNSHSSSSSPERNSTTTRTLGDTLLGKRGGQVKMTYRSIRVEGSERYKEQVKNCLDLIAKKSKKEYQLIEENIGVISQHGKSGMRAWETPPRYQMSDKTAFHSLSWCAGTIAHDAYHSFLYKKHLPQNGKRTDYNKWAGFSSEKKAIEFQIIVMRNIDARPSEIAYLKSLDGTHGDVNGDGKLTKEDYELRDW